jgi:hypothetical protein
MARYLEGKIPDMSSLIAGLEKVPDDGEASNLRAIYKRSWRAMSGLTHGGAEHFDYWSDGGVLEPAHTAGDVGRFLDFAARIGVVTAISLVDMSGDTALCERLMAGSLSRMPQRFDVIVRPAPSLRRGSLLGNI